MFYVYGSSGRTFEGTLEALRRVNRTSGIRSERTVVESSEDGELSGLASDSGSSSASLVSTKRAAQYGDMLVQQGNLEVAYHAYQVMTKPATCISAHWPLTEVSRCFRSFPFQVFPIVDERQQLVGILSRKQFYEYLLTDEDPQRSLSATTAQVFIDENSEVYCADPVTDVRRIATLLVENKLDAVPVVADSGSLLGIVSRTDILKCTISDPPLSLWC